MMNTLWSGDDPLAVETRLLEGGKLEPTAFQWRGQRWTITGLGREWDEPDGRHMLVLVSDGSRFELCLTSDGSSWRLRRAWEQPHLA
jgi:hypothetical protein